MKEKLINLKNEFIEKVNQINTLLEIENLNKEFL